MGVPAVTQTETDGAIGVLPPSSGDLLAIVGWSSAGPIAIPATYGNVRALVADFGQGPLVEAAARHLDTTGNPVCVVRCDKTTAGAVGTITTARSGTSTCVVTADTNEPYDDFEGYFVVIHGGTIGMAGITVQYSLDGGRTLSPVTALGTANTFTFPDGNVKLDFAAGTLDAGDLFTFRTSAPVPNSTQLGAAIDSLGTTQITWSICEIAVAIDTTLFDTIETSFSTMFGNKKFKAWVGNIRMPNAGESESSYLSAQSGFSAKSTKVGELCFGACEIVSGVSRRKYRRPISFHVASREAAVEPHIDIADVTLGAAIGVSITDANGNPKHHDETMSPGGDDARFTTLRTWEGRQGVYVTRPRIFSSAGSDFYLMPHRRVMNLARATTRTYLEERLSKPILVNATTGFILEQEALEIESGGNARLAAVLGPKPMASGWRMVLARNDNLLSTRLLNVTTRIVPLAYVEFISESIGFENPALRLQAA
jgi:hypothetical protein